MNETSLIRNNINEKEEEKINNNQIDKKEEELTHTNTNKQSTLTFVNISSKEDTSKDIILNLSKIEKSKI